MSGRRFEVTGTQIVAGVLATVTGAIAASYLGVAGTVIGAAVMSVASTGGGAVYKYYLGRTARRVREAAPVITQRTVDRAATVGARSAARRGVPSGHPAGAPVPPADDAAADRGSGPVPDAGQDRADRSEDPAGRETGGEHRPQAGRRMRPGWLAVVAGSAGIFLGVIAAITVFELAAGKPLEAVVWHRSGSGTSVGGLVGGQTQGRPRHGSPARPTRTPSDRATSAGPGGTRTTPASPSPSPSTSGGSPSPSPSPSPSSSPSATSTPTSTRTP